MKKVFAVCLAAGLMSLVACGPSAEEQAKKEAELKAQMDSLFNKAADDMNSAMDSASMTTEPAAHDSTHAH
jgi:hypothetical protein